MPDKHYELKRQAGFDSDIKALVPDTEQSALIMEAVSFALERDPTVGKCIGMSAPISVKVYGLPISATAKNPAFVVYYCVIGHVLLMSARETKRLAD